MIYFDVTKTGRAGHKSGLMRVSQRLLAELGDAAEPVLWSEEQAGFVRADKTALQARLQPRDWLLTPELFSEVERPGLWAFLARRPCRLGAIFHDAIPLKLPHVTWPQSVSRHPEYMKMLARFDRVWAVSAASRADLLGWWRWIGLGAVPPVETLTLGADFSGTARAATPASSGPPGAPALLCVGILEPRKNQEFLLEVCDALWAEGLEFDLHLVGRVNPHFGERTVARIKRLQKTRIGLRYHAAASDPRVVQLYAQSRAAVFPTLAEGCGLPLLEALWQGVPCVCSDLPVLGENADAGGCLAAPVNDLAAWKDALRRVLTDGQLQTKLRAEIEGRRLPRWAETAEALKAGLAA